MPRPRAATDAVYGQRLIGGPGSERRSTVGRRNIDVSRRLLRHARVMRRIAEQQAVSAGIGLGIVLSSAAVTYVLLVHPRVATSAPAATAVGLLALAGLLCAYGYAAWVAHRPSTPDAAADVVVGGRFGIAVAGFWILEIVAGNVLGNHPYTQAIYMAALLGVVVSSACAGWVASSRSGRFTDGVTAGLWSGVTSGWVPLVSLLLIAVLLPGTVGADPQNIAQASHAGASNVLEFAIGDDLVAGINHLWLGPLLGLILGPIGAAVRGATVAST